MHNNWLENLFSDIPGAELTNAIPSRTTGELPREVLARNIEHNIKLVDDPSYTIKGRKKEAKPEQLFTTGDEFATVSLAYGRIKLALNGNGNNALRVPKPALKQTLEKLKLAVEAGAFDDQLGTIKNKRVAKLKAKRERKTAA